MSDRQRLINKYVLNLTRPISTVYQLFILKQETDEPSTIMLTTSLNDIANETGSQELVKIMDELKKDRTKASIRLGKFIVKEKKTRNEFSGERSSSQLKDYAHKGTVEMGQLRFENALKSFQRAKAQSKMTNEGYYRQRAELNFVIRNYTEAFSLAKKSYVPELEFITAIASGNFDHAAKIAVGTLLHSATNKERTVYVTNYELYHLATYIALAKMTSNEAAEIHSLIQKSNYDIPFIEQIMFLFVERRYVEVLQLFNDIESLLNFSIFTVNVTFKLLNQIKANIIANVVLPYCNISFSTISHQLGIPEDEIEQMLLNLITDGSILGKLDLEKGVYLGGNGNARIKNMIDIYEQAYIMREKLETSIYSKQMNGCIEQK